MDPPGCNSIYGDGSAPVSRAGHSYGSSPAARSATGLPDYRSVLHRVRAKLRGSVLLHPYLLRRVMAPFTVLRRISTPPLPILPSMCRRSMRPWMVIGKSSDEMLPFTVVISRSAFRSAGNSTVIEPLTVSYSTGALPTTPARTLMPPLTVLALTGPPVDEASMPPLTVRAFTSALTPSTVRPPFTVDASVLTPFGRRMVRSTETSLRSPHESRPCTL